MGGDDNALSLPGEEGSVNGTPTARRGQGSCLHSWTRKPMLESIVQLSQKCSKWEAIMLGERRTL